MTDYDPAVIHEFADKLYVRAQQIVVVSALAGGVIGFGAGFSISRLGFGGSGTDLPALIVAAIGVAIGYVVGQARSFALRLQAQTALCQVQIERNTRVAPHGAA